MKNIKLVVKVNRGGNCAPKYVQRVDQTPIQMTTNRKLALADWEVHGGRRGSISAKLPGNPELESVHVST
jgi:hypothetical protein